MPEVSSATVRIPKYVETGYGRKVVPCPDIALLVKATGYLWTVKEGDEVWELYAFSCGVSEIFH